MRIPKKEFHIVIDCTDEGCTCGECDGSPCDKEYMETLIKDLLQDFSNLKIVVEDSLVN